MNRAKPYISVVTICEKVLQEQDGVLSAIRMVDTVVLEQLGKESLEARPIISLFVLVSLKSGPAQGKYTLKIVPVTPSGKELKSVELPFVLEGGEKGSNVIVDFRLQVSEFGLHWFVVKIDDDELSRIPLNLLRKPPQDEKSGSV